MVDDLKSRLCRVPIHAGDVGKEIERARRVFPQQSASFSDGRSIEDDGHLVAVKLDTLNGPRIPTLKTGDCRMVLQFFKIGDRGRKRHYGFSPAIRVSPQSRTPFFHT